LLRAGLSLCVAAEACSSRTEKPVTRVAEKYVAPKAATPAPAAARPESPFDAEGRLKSSGKTLGWLDLPLGLIEKNQHGAHHAYLATVPIQALTQYFDARVFTSKVELVGDSVQYHGVQPKGQRARGMRFDIALYPNRYDGMVRVTIDELPDATMAPLSVNDANGLLRQQQQRAE
jgi:hypothetical protein